MDSPVINKSLVDYQQALQTWIDEEKTLDNALNILRNRDILHDILKKETTPTADVLKHLQAVDETLKQEGQVMKAYLDFKYYRDSLGITEDQWWWSLDSLVTDKSKQNPYTLLLDSISFGSWIFALALLIDISRRFLLGGAGVAGLSLISFSNIFAFLKARKDLSSVTTGSFDILFSKSQGKAGTKCISSLSLSSIFFIFWLNLPNVSRYYNNRGVTDQSRASFSSAESNYHRAIALHPQNKTAYYNLATLYEDIGEIDQAIAEYNIAMEEDALDVYNNLARLYIYKGNSLDRAVQLLQQAITLNQRLSDIERSPEITFALYKNLGWARLQGGYLAEAEPLLKEAIKVAGGSEFWDVENSKSPQDDDVEQTIYSLGSAYCLLAQTLDQQNSPISLKAWEYCCLYADPAKINEDAWLLEARTNIQKTGQNPEDLSCKSTNPLDQSAL